MDVCIYVPFFLIVVAIVAAQVCLCVCVRVLFLLRTSAFADRTKEKIKKNIIGAAMQIPLSVYDHWSEWHICIQSPAVLVREIYRPCVCFFFHHSRVWLVHKLSTFIKDLSILLLPFVCIFFSHIAYDDTFSLCILFPQQHWRNVPRMYEQRGC